jgi:hypothetical protein
MAIRTTRVFRLGGVVGTGANAGATYVVPAGHRLLIRSLVVNQLTNGASRWTLYNQSSGGGVFRPWLDLVFAAGVTGYQEIRPWSVAEAGETLQTGGTNGITANLIVVSGVLLQV